MSDQLEMIEAEHKVVVEKEKKKVEETKVEEPDPGQIEVDAIIKFIVDDMINGGNNDGNV